ncbi:YmfL family putative regulatory protein [Rodentibacter caecimuris]|uniref:YmfL family putative regulatory protein n=1 Tax=Rodentibacter caecimuris TaxID=1796644 RepID=UPI00258F1290|nr:YmfL family putative regulatory protein [Rodentibacter heylii]
MAMKKTIIEMIEKCAGGKSAVASFLGLNETQLNNRLYQTKGQRFTNEELLAIQQEYGLTDFTDEICRLSGGRFVPDVERETLDNTEISTLQFQELSARGVLYAVLAQSLQDGEITSDEEDKIRRLLDKHLTATQLSVESVILLNKRQ